jgi:hypothetical protein
MLEDELASSSRLGKPIRKVYPTTISVNQKSIVLDKSFVSQTVAKEFLAQARVPGFSEGISHLRMLIFEDVEYIITERVMARPEKWSEWFPKLSNDQVSDWILHSTVLEAAMLVHALFGPNAVTQQKQTVSLETQLRALEFGWDLGNECYDDSVSLSINNLIRDHTNVMEPFSNQRNRELVKLLTARLPVESHVTTTFRLRTEALSAEARLNETPKTFLRRLNLILGEARTAIKAATLWQTPSLRINTNAKGVIITKSSDKTIKWSDKAAPTSNNTASGSQTSCNTCGEVSHLSPACPLTDTIGTNTNNKCPWAHSAYGKAWKDAGYSCFTHNVQIPKLPNYGRHNNQGGRDRNCKSKILSTIHSDFSPSTTDFLTVTVSLKSQTERRAAEMANRGAVEEGAGPKATVLTLLDTGSLAGNFLSDRIVGLLDASDYIYHSKKAFSVCSGLDNTCYESNDLLDLLITYLDERNNKKLSIFITAFISKNSPIDLILGRASIRKFNFVTTNPSHFRFSDQKSQKVKPSGKVESVTPENGMKNQKVKKLKRLQHDNTSTILSSSVHACLCNASVTEVAKSSVPMNLDLKSSDLGSADLHRGQCDLHPLPSVMPAPAKWGFVATLLRQSEQHHEVQTVDDEIDDEKADSFAAFLPPDTASEPVDFISLITFEGDEELQRKCKALCRRYVHLFSDKLNAEPADIPPFDMEVDDARWKTYANRGAVRIQTPAKEAEINKQIQKLLAAGIIERSPASHYSQVLLAKKANGEYRFCIDFRKLNECTEDAAWPIPHIKSMLNRIGTKGSDTFGVMDLTSGYHQAPLTKSARVYTAFICFAGIYQFTRLPFGPKRAPSYFQEQMASVVLLGLIYIICEMYVDDCIVHAKGNDQFLERLEAVFQRFSKCKILLQAKKCKFGMKKIEYVGRQISKDGISMSPERIKSVVDFPKPTTNTSLRSFLGLANYMRDFVKNHSDLAQPLFAMIDQAKGKNHKIVWNEVADQAFIKMKVVIHESPLLYFADDNEPIVLMTDASDYGIGGHLFQKIWNPVTQKREVHTVAFVSKSLTETQLRWSVIQKEAYAVFHCCTHLENILRDRHFLIQTDHKNLTYMNLDSNAMVIRWYLALQEFDYTIEYIPGDQNEVADSLSRLCPNLMTSPANTLSTSGLTHPSNTLSAIIPDREIPDEYYDAIRKCHNSIVGHGGVERTVKKIHASRQGWLYLTQDVKKFISNCACCQKMSQINIPIHAVKYIASTYHTMECLNIDFVGPYPDNGYVLVIIDTFTRWVELYPCEAATAMTALDGLLKHFGRFGCPRAIRSDRGSHFVNEIITGFLLATGTPHNLSLAYSSEENSIVERANKEINRHVTAYTFDHDTAQNWRVALPFVQRIINSSYNQRTRIAPADLLFGNQIQLDRGILLPFEDRSPNATPLPNHLALMLTMQDKLIKISQELLKSSDAKHLAQTGPNITEFEIGTHVLVAYEAGPPTRLLTRWKGPMQILKRHKSEYLLLDLVTGKEKTFHVKNLRIFKFNPQKVNPLDVARHDYDEFFVEKVLAHEGDFRKVSTLLFQVRWQSYSPEFDSWEPWKNLRNSEQLHEYLHSIGKSKFIPKPK